MNQKLLVLILITILYGIGWIGLLLINWKIAILGFILLFAHNLEESNKRGEFNEK